MTKKRTAGAQKHKFVTAFTVEKGEKFCRLRAAGCTIQECCDQIGIDRMTYYNWVAKGKSGDEPRFENFVRHLSDAHEKFADGLADRLIEESIKERPSVETIHRDGPDTKNVFDQTREFDNVKRSELRVNSIKWLLSKIAPDKYGDKQQVDVNNVTPVQVVFKDDLED